MKNNKEFLVEEWIKRAEDDERNILAILKDRGGTPAHVCFVCQQMSEKYLKALLLFYTSDYPKTHDLNQLATLLKEFKISIVDELGKAIDLLSLYYISTRYPSDIPIESFTWEMAEESYKAATAIKEFVNKCISL